MITVRMFWSGACREGGRHVARLTLATVGHCLTMTSIAQESHVLARTAPQPPTADILSSLNVAEDAKLFAAILRTSELTLRDFDGQYVTFLVPRDAACKPDDRADVENLTSKEASRSYVLNHAFYGAVSIVNDFQYGPPHVRFAWYDAGAGSAAKRVAIDNENSFNLKLLSGRSVVMSLRDGLLYFGKRSTGYESFSAAHGAGIYLDNCAMF